MTAARPEKIAPAVIVRDEYGNQHTVTPPGWMWVMAFALRGCQWAIDEIEPGRCDAAQRYLAAHREAGALI